MKWRQRQNEGVEASGLMNGLDEDRLTVAYPV